jgi:hypothetical protein
LIWALVLPLIAAFGVWFRHETASEQQAIWFAIAYTALQIGLFAGSIVAWLELVHARQMLKAIERELDRRGDDYM